MVKYMHIIPNIRGPLGIRWNINDIPIVTMIQRWWALKPKNRVHQTILQVTPVVIFWEIWKARCAVKFGGKRVYVKGIIYQILTHLKWILAKTEW